LTSIHPHIVSVREELANTLNQKKLPHLSPTHVVVVSTRGPKPLAFFYLVQKVDLAHRRIDIILCNNRNNTHQGVPGQTNYSSSIWTELASDPKLPLQRDNLYLCSRYANTPIPTSQHLILLPGLPYPTSRNMMLIEVSLRLEANVLHAYLHQQNHKLGKHINGCK